ncbi:MAG: O-antigen ligase family protein [bacterium]
MPNDITMTHDFRTKFVAFLHLVLMVSLPVLFLLSHRNIVSWVTGMALFVLLTPHVFSIPKNNLHKDILFRPSPVTVQMWLFVFCAYALISALWSPACDPVEWVLKLFFHILLAGILLWSVTGLDALAKQRLARFYLGAAFSAALVLAFEGVSNGALRHLIPPDNNHAKDMIAAARGTTLLIGMVFPALTLLIVARWRAPDQPTWKTTSKTLSLLTLVATAAIMLDIMSNVVALAAGIVALFIATFWPKFSLKLTLSGFAFALLTAPFWTLFLPPVTEITASAEGPVSMVHRLAIWRYTGEAIFASPWTFLFGHGVRFGHYLAVNPELITIKDVPVALAILPSHPHNFFLHVWLEFGVVGAALLLAALFQGARWVLAQNFPAQYIAALCAFGAALFVYFNVEFSLWSLWRLDMIILGLYGFGLVQYLQKD